MNGVVQVRARRGELAAAIVLVVFSCWMLWSALQMPLGTGASPGPGTVPAALGALLLATSLGLVIRAVRLAGAPADTRIAIGHSHIWLVLGALILVGFLFEPLGYILTMGLFLTTLLRRFSGRGWLRAAATAIVITLVSYFFFHRLLGVNLPLGLLRFGQ